MLCPKRSCGMVLKLLGEAINTTVLTMVLLPEKQSFDFTTLRKTEAYIDRARSFYDGSFKRNGVELSWTRSFVDANTVEVNGELIRANTLSLQRVPVFILLFLAL